MDEMYDEVVEVKQLVEFEGEQAEVNSFDIQSIDDRFAINFNFIDYSDVVKGLATNFIENKTVDFKLIEGDAVINVTGAKIEAMYGFRSFALTAENIGVVKN